jgi:hypothetical protein
MTQHDRHVQHDVPSELLRSTVFVLKGKHHADHAIMLTPGWRKTVNRLYSCGASRVRSGVWSPRSDAGAFSSVRPESWRSGAAIFPFFAHAGSRRDPFLRAFQIQKEHEQMSFTTPNAVNQSNTAYWQRVTYDAAARPIAPPAPTPAPLKVRKPGAGWWMRAIPTTTDPLTEGRKTT